VLAVELARVLAPRCGLRFLARSPAGSHARSPIAIAECVLCRWERRSDKVVRERKYNIYYMKTLVLCELISIEDFLLTGLLGYHA